MIKIKTYKLSRRGSSGSVMALPAVWVRDLDLKPGDRLDIYRDKHDRLIIVPPSRNTATAHAERTKGVRS